MFERLTARASDAVVVAQAVAREARADRTGAEHLLVALAGGDGIAARVLGAAGAGPEVLRAHLGAVAGPAGSDAEALRSLGIDLELVRARVEEVFGPGALDAPARPRRLRLDPSAKAALAGAVAAAGELRHTHLGTEHLLLGLLADADGPAARLLRASGVDLDRRAARDGVYDELKRSA